MSRDPGDVLVRLSIPTALMIATSLVQAAPAQSRSAVLVGWIKDSTGGVVIGAEVSIEARRAVARTDSSGRFRLANLEPGSVVVRIRRVGFDPQTFDFTLKETSVDSVSVTLEQSAKLLEAMRTNAEVLRQMARLEEFYRRRARGSGYFVTREDLERSNALVASESLRQIPGLRVVRAGAARGGLRFQSSTSKPYDCPPQYWVDGRRVRGLEIDDIPVSDIEGIELYSGASSTPVQFGQGGTIACGTVVIWTRVPGVPPTIQ